CIFVLATQPMSVHLLFSEYLHHRYLHSFPTRRSSDLTPRNHGSPHEEVVIKRLPLRERSGASQPRLTPREFLRGRQISRSAAVQDRKSTRLNSSHVAISYAVFCLKKKTRLNAPLGSTT